MGSVSLPWGPRTPTVLGRVPAQSQHSLGRGKGIHSPTQGKSHHGKPGKEEEGAQGRNWAPFGFLNLIFLLPPTHWCGNQMPGSVVLKVRTSFPLREAGWVCSADGPCSKRSGPKSWLYHILCDLG